MGKTPKLRAIALREIKLVSPSQLKNEKVTAALSNLTQSLNDLGQLQSQADLLHVEAVLVSEGINDNDDAFMRDELRRAISSPILKPMNWQHDEEQILGAMYAVEARDLEGNTLSAEEIKDQPIELVIQGVVWHHLPHIKATANEIVQRIEQGNLFVSMECWFNDYEYGLYTQAGDLFDQIPRTPETVFLDGHLRANGGTGRYNGMRIGRALSGVSFGGIAFVDRPANKRSFILNHFAFDPSQLNEEVEASRDGLDQDPVITKTTLLSNVKEPTEVTMNDLNRAAASADEITVSVEKALDARDRVSAAKNTAVNLDKAVSRVAELEKQLAEASSKLGRLQEAIEQAYAGATSNTPAEIAKIDQALNVKGEGAGDAVFAAKIAFIGQSRAAIAEELVATASGDSDTKLVEENTALKAELTGIKTDLRKREIEYLFAEVLEMETAEVELFVKAGLAKASDEDYSEWLEEKKIFAKKMLDLKKGKDKEGKEEKKKEEAGLLSPSQRETPVDDEAVLRSEFGSAPADVSRTPRSKLTASADLEEMFEEVDGPNLAGASADEGNSASPMGHLVANLLGSPKKDKEV
jgi:chaperonin cofactor prefoldin